MGALSNAIRADIEERAELALQWPSCHLRVQMSRLRLSRSFPRAFYLVCKYRQFQICLIKEAAKMLSQENRVNPQSLNFIQGLGGVMFGDLFHRGMGFT